MEAQRNKDLTEAKSLYEKNKAALESNTAAMLQNTGTLNEARGYKLELKLFNFSPAYGPSSNTPGGAGATGSSGADTGAGGGGPSTSTTDGGRGTAVDDRTPVVLMLDGKVIANSTLRQLRKQSQAQFGTSDRWNEVLPS
jgi:hypothetical protein